MFNHHHHQWIVFDGSDSFTEHVYKERKKWVYILTVFFVIIIIKQINPFFFSSFTSVYLYMSAGSRIRCYQEHTFIHHHHPHRRQLIWNSQYAIRSLHKYSISSCVHTIMLSNEKIEIANVNMSVCGRETVNFSWE